MSRYEICANHGNCNEVLFNMADVLGGVNRHVLDFERHNVASLMSLFVD